MRRVDHEWWDSVHNMHRGERAFVLATGPSLAKVELDRLKGEFTVGVNELYKWKRLPFTPNMWGARERDFGASISQGVAHMNIPKIWACVWWPFFDPDPSWRWIYQDPGTSFNRSTWHQEGDSLDSIGLGDEFWRVGIGYSPVTDAAIPPLVWMGFREIYLLGVDHTSQGYVWDQSVKRMQRIEATNRSYVNMEIVLREHGRTLLNCSPGSEARLPYRPLEEVLGVRVA